MGLIGKLMDKIIKPTEPSPSRKEWTRRALEISMSFEGNDPWANIVGDFDGAGLTCGALGWTVKWGNQLKLVTAFCARHHPDRARELMPTCWDWYRDMLTLSPEGSLKKASKISTGVRVKEPYKSELRAFWKSPEMVAIQVEAAEQDMGMFAWDQAIKCRDFFELDQLRFHHFAFWFDQAVQSGRGKTPKLEEAYAITTEHVLEWMLSEDGAGIRDFRKNRELWEKLLPSRAPDQIHLWKLAKIRADRCREEYDTAAMNRRGTLALGQGWVNGQLRDLTTQLGLRKT